MSILRPRRRGLAAFSPLRLVDLRWFDLSQGTAVAVRSLHTHLGTRDTIRVVVALGRRARHDPFEHVAIAGWDPNALRLACHQLRPVLLVDDALRDTLELSDQERLVVLREVVAETGARFVGRYLRVPDRRAWRRGTAAERTAFVRGLTARMFNARVERLDVGDGHLAFDVTACLFVALCRAVDRPSLAALFCEADARQFARADALVTLDRTTTLADGGGCCDFRFRYRG